LIGRLTGTIPENTTSNDDLITLSLKLAGHFDMIMCFCGIQISHRGMERSRISEQRRLPEALAEAKPT
jgi:hypothetical protein